MPGTIHRRAGRRAPMRVIALVSVLGVLAAIVLAAGPAQSSVGSAAGPASPAAPAQDATSTTLPSSIADLDTGRIAYVTPAGDVVVADSDGANAVTVGSGAVTNNRGLAPLSWRQPAADAITYVRNDGSLMVAPIDGSAPLVMATDAVVPPNADETILSWDFTGSFLIYLAKGPGDRVLSKVIDLTTADDQNAPEVRTIGNAGRRTVLAQAFSPLDPIIYQKTADSDTGELFTVAIVEPIDGTVFGSDYSFDDVTFTPDGRYVFAVSKDTGNVEQLVRLSMRNPRGVDLVSDHDRICNPSVSPDAKLIVFAAGDRCQEVWTIKTNGTDPKRIAKSVGGTATFELGQFTWSQDSATISHASCKGNGASATCGGGYWDISVDGRDVRPRAVAGSVVRESRPLLRSVKVQIDITGPVNYSGRIQLGVDSESDPFATGGDEKIRAKGIDENDGSRSFEVKAVHKSSSEWIAGTLRVVDGGFDETFPFVGRLQPFSLGYAKLRGLWTRSESLPMQSGQIVVTVER